MTSGTQDLNFDGVQTYVEIPESSKFSVGTGLTVSAGIRPNGHSVCTEPIQLRLQTRTILKKVHVPAASAFIFLTSLAVLESAAIFRTNLLRACGFLWLAS